MQTCLPVYKFTKLLADISTKPPENVIANLYVYCFTCLPVYINSILWQKQREKRSKKEEDGCVTTSY